MDKQASAFFGRDAVCVEEVLPPEPEYPDWMREPSTWYPPIQDMEPAPFWTPGFVAICGVSGITLLIGVAVLIYGVMALWG